MDEAGEGSSEPVFYGPPRPPEMLEAMRRAEAEAQAGRMVFRQNTSGGTTAQSQPVNQGSQSTRAQAEQRSLEDDEYVPSAEGEDDGDEESHEAEDDEEMEEDDADLPAALGAPNVDISVLGGFAEGITRHQLIGLIQTQNMADIFNFVDSDDSSVESIEPIMRRRPRRRVPPPVAKPTVEGMRLQGSGVFGANEVSRRSKKHMMRRMLEREHGLGSLADRRRNSGLLTQDMIPEMRAEKILHYDEPVYSGQFSDDGNFYYSVCQDFKVRMYDTSNPYEWKHYKTVSYPWGSWTLTDASLSPDNKWLVYASHSALVSIAPTDPLDRGDPYTLNLEGGLQGQDVEIARRMNFSIFSIRFSGDGRELVAGTRQNTIVLFDIESRSVVQTILGHEDDVNAVCFGDKDEPHLIYSGSDDGVLKVWDRRSLSDKREAGAFVGHKGGLTYIDSKNDGRYILSNGKDQTAKLWDVRMAYSTAQFRAEDMTQYTRYSEYDYRYMDDVDIDDSPHPKDNSLVTFRGHKVQRTLIRCHFAPPGSANSRYVYSGSSDGHVHIWNMDSTVAKVIDVGKATKGTRSKDGRRRYFAFDDANDEWETCVRDVSWHPHAPVMAASAWNSYNMSRGTTSVHSFTDAHADENDVPMGRSYNAVMQRQAGLYDMKYD